MSKIVVLKTLKAGRCAAAACQQGLPDQGGWRAEPACTIAAPGSAGFDDRLCMAMHAVRGRLAQARRRASLCCEHIALAASDLI